MSLYKGLINSTSDELGRISLDGKGWKFEFTRYSIYARPSGTRAVYVFATAAGHVLYIGRAEDLTDRVGNHDRIAEAVSRGASELWVHRTGPYSSVHFHDVEKQLIQTYCPQMNTQHNSLVNLGRPDSIPAAWPAPASFGMLSGLGMGAPNTPPKLGGLLGLAQTFDIPSNGTGQVGLLAGLKL